MIFEVPGFLFGAESGSDMGSKSHLRRGSPRKASWRPLSLGDLLERSWRLLEPKKQSWNRSWPLLEASQDSFHKKQMGPPKLLSTLIFEVPGWGLKLDPHFMSFQEDFKAFQKQI